MPQEYHVNRWNDHFKSQYLSVHSAPPLAKLQKDFENFENAENVENAENFENLENLEETVERC